MPKWTKPSEALPDVEAGDRVIVIWRNSDCEPPKFEAFILEREEDGDWRSPDYHFMGFTPFDGVLWTTEKDLCGIAAAMKEAGEL